MTTTNQADDCCSSCAGAADNRAWAIACTLGASDFENRVAAIRDLAARHLLSSRGEPLALHPTYAAQALPEVADLVAKEAYCCALLDFDLWATREQVELTIKAPESAALAANELFAHFAPELARAAA